MSHFESEGEREGKLAVKQVVPLLKNEKRKTAIVTKSFHSFWSAVGIGKKKKEKRAKLYAKLGTGSMEGMRENAAEVLSAFKRPELTLNRNKILSRKKLRREALLEKNEQQKRKRNLSKVARVSGRRRGRRGNLIAI